ncbi:DUF6282 family protein [Sporosarcina cascadiensis]|uniref:DUF6282 family protein n=1 Tax=Sporosarcina cascadiensis TaxID=2660747 RepID=UPI00129B884E|nr:DUF6282 family protein [Sporosarcina cascadiensis]
MKELLKGVIDMHVHSKPDIAERAYSDIDLMNAGIRVGARAIVIKNHFGTSMNRAYLLNEMKTRGKHKETELTMFGSITLNKAIGGLNPFAVEAGLKMGAKIVWLPTIHARNHMEKLSQGEDGIICVQDNKVVKELECILQLIKEYDAVLATGHLSPDEIFTVVKEAKRLGIDKIVVTHPEFWIVGMSMQEQIEITQKYNVFLELCYAQPMPDQSFKNNLPGNLEIIRNVGYQNVLVSTDGGQVENPFWEDALEEYITFLMANQIPVQHITYMTQELPARLLNLI